MPTPSPLLLLDTIDGIRARNPRYARNAYLFVLGALQDVVSELPPERLVDPVRRHLSGRELLVGVVALARREFGMLAPVVFREWGVLANEDVGRMVFELVGSGQLTARPEDSPEDFEGGPDLMRLLEAPRERTA